jgi:hypothetical protein
MKPATLETDMNIRKNAKATAFYAAEIAHLKLTPIAPSFWTLNAVDEKRLYWQGRFWGRSAIDAAIRSEAEAMAKRDALAARGIAVEIEFHDLAAGRAARIAALEARIAA